MGKVGKHETGSLFLLACFPSSLLFLRVFFMAGLTAHSHCTVRFLRVSLWDRSLEMPERRQSSGWYPWASLECRSRWVWSRVWHFQMKVLSVHTESRSSTAGQLSFSQLFVYCIGSKYGILSLRFPLMFCTGQKLQSY